jgi:uncharacterized membrane protein
MKRHLNAEGKFVVKLLLLVAVAVFAPLLWAATNGVAEVAAPAAAEEPFDLRKFLAPFHSVVLHYPIGFVTLAFILELITFRNKSPEVRKITVLVMGLAALTAVASAALGFFRASGDEYEPSALSSHKYYGVAVTALTVVGFCLVLAISMSGASRILLPLHRVLLMANIAVLVIAGHLGGNLTHGSDYLFEGAPESVKAFLKDMDLMGTSEPDAMAVKNEGEKYYVEHVLPIFKAKCYSCHGPEKQRGDYRLDQKEVALKGGESGEKAIIPGKPMESYLVKLILLPSDDDDVMPPEGKQALTPEEIGKVLAWVRNGAAFPDAAPAATAAPAAK